METKTNIDTKEIIMILAKIQQDMDFIKEHIKDITLTEDDLNSIEEARKDLKGGKTRGL